MDKPNAAPQAGGNVPAAKAEAPAESASLCVVVPQRFNLSPQELADLCTFSFGMSCDAPEDAMPITIGWLPEHEDGPGWYVWGEEYPEEGSVPINKRDCERPKRNG